MEIRTWQAVFLNSNDTQCSNIQFFGAQKHICRGKIDLALWGKFYVAEQTKKNTSKMKNTCLKPKKSIIMSNYRKLWDSAEAATVSYELKRKQKLEEML